MISAHPTPTRAGSTAGSPVDPLWYKQAVVYELHVRAFADSNGDGIGDFRGLTERLDYLSDLGVTALWLLPFYPSPLRDGGYDIADYTSVNPAYGTLDDFKVLLDEAHRRGVRIITELVINHTSVEHAWFQRARRAPAGSPARDFYVWSDTPERYGQARIIFKDFETSNWAWDAVAKAYYWHRFYSHQPDLNFDNPAVHAAIFEVLDFWLSMGVDGLRLDAVPYLYEREGTSCENLEETHAFLRKLRAYVDARYTDRLLLAEANQWPVDAVAYFGSGDECHMNFHFPLMPRMFMAVQMEDRFPVADILKQTPSIPASCQWATFLRNHDELTLEMVTDEERDYMYRVYTEDPIARLNLGIRRRLVPLLRTRRKVELMTALLFALPGTPVLYYGDEIGMGDNVYLGDRDGVRTPMQWSADRNAGFSRANPQRLYLPVIIDPEYHYEAVNVELQQASSASLLWWTKRLIALRKAHPVFGAGALTLLRADNPKVLAFVRSTDEEQVLVVANLSRHPQYVDLDLSAHAGQVPVEMFGRTRFPVIGTKPYLLTFAPHAFYWFRLESVRGATPRELASFHVEGAWTRITHERKALSRALAEFVRERPWFRGEGRQLEGENISDLFEATTHGGRLLVVLLELEYQAGDPEIYVIPLAFATGEAATSLRHRAPHTIVAELTVEGDDTVSGVLYDALANGRAAALMLALTRSQSSLSGERGRLVGAPEPALAASAGDAELPAEVMAVEQTNSILRFERRVLLKVYRHVEPGTSAELEVGAYLGESGRELAVPRVLGSISYVREHAEPTTIALFQTFVENEGTAWQLFERRLEALFDRVLASGAEAPEGLLQLAGQELRSAHRLGQLVARIHAALAASSAPSFAPEPFTVLHQQSLYQRSRALLVRACEELEVRLPSLAADAHREALRLLDRQAEIERRLAVILRPVRDAKRIRVHGDLHLGQVLFTGDDFSVIDFEGETSRPLRERRYKRSALFDVAGMLWSFDSVAVRALQSGRARPQDLELLRPWAKTWAFWVGAAFLEAYLAEARPAGFLPGDDSTSRRLLDFYRLEKCVHMLGRELSRRDASLDFPLRAVLEPLAEPAP